MLSNLRDSQNVDYFLFYKQWLSILRKYVCEYTLTCMYSCIQVYTCEYMSTWKLHSHISAER